MPKSKSRNRNQDNVKSPTSLSIEEKGECEIDNTLLFKKLKTRTNKFIPKTEHQKDFAHLIEEKQIIIASGPAGTGKSYVSVIKALDLLASSDNKFNKIIVITPLVDAEEKIGFIPGSIDEKSAPYTDSTFSIFEKIMTKKPFERILEKGTVQVKLLAFLRGASIDNALVIFEEAQNSTKHQMKTFLTRIGTHSKFIISGDIEQIDRQFPKNTKNGLEFIIDNLRGIEDIGVMKFGKEDIVRNPIISKILERFID